MIGLVIGLVITIGLPLMVLYWMARRTSIPRAVPRWAIVFCLLSLALTVPLNAYVWPLVFGARSAFGTLLLSSLTLGICQEIARFGSFRYPTVMKEYRDHEGALAAGFAHGAVGSILAGLQVVAGTGIMLLIPGKFPIETLRQTLIDGGPEIVFHAIRQLPLIACSMAFGILIVLAYRRARTFLALAIVAHVGVLCLVSMLPFFWGQAVLGLCGGLSLLLIYGVIRSGVIAPRPRADERLPADPGVRLTALAGAPLDFTDADPEPSGAGQRRRKKR